MLHGEKVILRAWQESDLEILGALRNDVETQRNLMSVPRPNSPARVREWLQNRSSDAHGLFFVITTLEGETAGFVQLVGMDALHGNGTLGIGLHTQFRGRGLARESIELLENFAREVHGTRKISLQVLAANTNAIGLYRSCGYAEVGVQKAHFYANDRRHDVLMMEKMLVEP